MLCNRLFVLYLVFCLFCSAFAQEQEQNSAPLELKASGKGLIQQDAPNKAQAKLMGERAARLDAMRNLLAKIQSVLGETNSEGTVKGILSGHKFQNMQVSEDGTLVSIEVVLPLEELVKNYYQALFLLEESQKKAKESEEAIRQKAEEWEKLRSEQEKILEEKNKQIQEMEKELEKEKSEKQEKEKKIQEIEGQAQENASLQEQKGKEFQQQILVKEKKIEDLENALQMITNRYQEQQKALLAFEDYKKKVPEYKENQEILEQRLQECIAEKKLLEKKIEEITPGFLAFQSERESTLSELKKTREEQLELQENFKKLIEILGHLHAENKDFLEKYHNVMKNLLEKESELARAKENIEIYKIRLQNIQKNMEEAKQKYHTLSESYKNIISQNRVVMEGLSKKDSLDKAVKEIYINQQIFLNKFQAIEHSLERIEDILNQDFSE